MQILITAGGTEEPIDGVRTISNFSTGRTGAKIADALFNAGFKVTLLTSRRGFKPEASLKTIRYQSFNELDSIIKELLKNNMFNAVIHLAAVSDFSVDYLESNGEKIIPNTNAKLDSSKPLTIKLKPNFKIISKIKSYSSAPLTLVAFKLTKNADNELIKEKVNTLFQGNKVDFVVHNDLTSIDKNSHISTIYNRNGIIKSCTTKEELAAALIKILKEI